MTEIFFGKILNVEDTEHLCRCRISINGFTDKLNADEMPWYYPWYGLNYLPEPDDIVPVLVFDNNFSTAFYGNKINLDKTENSKLDGDDYKHYLEIFKRNIDDKNVQLTYTKSKGIEFINDKNGEIIMLDKIKLFVDSTDITITNDLITIGNNGLEFSLMGDKTVKHLQNIIKHQQNTINNMYQGFQKIIAGCTSPFTLPIAAQLGPHLATQAKLVAENSQCNSETNRIQSKHVKIGTK